MRFDYSEELLQEPGCCKGPFSRRRILGAVTGLLSTALAGCSTRDVNPPTPSPDITTPSATNTTSPEPSAKEREPSELLEAGDVNLYLRPPAPRTTVSQSSFVETMADPSSMVPTAAGRANARAIGDALTALGATVEKVATSPRPLDRETARLAFGHGTPGLAFELTASVTPSATPPAERTLATALSAPPPEGAINAFIGSKNAFAAVTDTSLASGECAVIDPAGDKLDVWATGRPTEWVSSAQAAGQRRTVYQIRRGTAQATPVIRLRTATPGPTVLVIGGIHGDEVAGYRAAEAVTQWRMEAGTVVVVPRANSPAVERGTRTPESGVDLNRQFPLDGPPATPLARELYNCVVRHGPDVVIDLHSSQGIWGEGGFGQAIFHSHDDTLATRLNGVVDALNEEVIPEDRLPEYAYQAVASDGDPPGLFVTKVARSLGIPSCLHEVAEVDVDASTQVKWTEAVVARLLTEYDV